MMVRRSWRENIQLDHVVHRCAWRIKEEKEHQDDSKPPCFEHQARTLPRKEEEVFSEDPNEDDGSEQESGHRG